MAIDEKVKVKCAKCKQLTNHLIVKEIDHSDTSIELEFSWRDFYQIIQCAGCESLSFRHMYSDDSMFNDDTGCFDEQIQIFPDPDIKRGLLSGSHNLPSTIQELYKEVIDACNSNSYYLSSIGIRSLIESVCIDQGCKVEGNLEKSINGLRTKGIVSDIQADSLQISRTFLNMTVHEIKRPKNFELYHLLNTLDSILNNLYILPRNDSWLSKTKNQDDWLNQ